MLPGPRTQSGPLPGYDNPNGEQPDRFNNWHRPNAIAVPGRSPGLTGISLRGNILGPGTVRKLWRQSVNFTPAQGSFSWANNANDTDSNNPIGITRALRYMTRSVYVGAGIDNTRTTGLHTRVTKTNAYKAITTGAGQTRSRPTTRNRMSSFGSRVTPLNPSVAAASNSDGSKSNG
jgi:hypothetical protein